MSIPEDCLGSALYYITGAVDEKGDVRVIDIGRDVIRSDSILIVTWNEESGSHSGSFAEAVFRPEHIARQYSPDGNVRVAYDHDARPPQHDELGEWSSVTFYDVGAEYREYYRTRIDEGYEPTVGALETFGRVIASRSDS